MANVAQDKLNVMVENIISKIENNETGSWFKSWIGTGIPTNYATKTNYNGFNILVLMFEAQEKGYKSNYWLTFNQIKALKGTVKKGEAATPVFFFKPLTIKETDTETNEEKEKTIPLLKFYNVFNLDQTDIEIGNNEATFNGDIEEFISNLDIEIKNDAEAYYSPKKDFVAIPHISLFDTTDNYYSVLCHELSHASAAKHRLNRDLTGFFGSESYAKEELIAELGSVFLCSHLGIQSSIRHEAYLKGWLSAAKADPKFLWKSASEAQKILDYFIKKQIKQEKAA
ncbi:zincin-like metallopeptidase domain-containing protein [Aliarcobacter butzleri]|uniref:ArdC family protein n=1 Tax=Aliarcobacter butzleri TaxID=28197 RepID=UPI00344DE0EE